MVKIYLEDREAIPSFATELAVGADVKALKLLTIYKGDQEIEPERLQKLQETFLERGEIKLRAFERALFGTKVFVVDMDKETEIQVRNRSGNPLKKGLVVMNSPGTVDPDYRGEIGVIIGNMTPFLSTVTKGMHIAQLVIGKVSKEPIEVVSVKGDATERGEGGYGHTRD